MQHLVSVSVIGSHDDMTDESLSSAVHQELTQWFGEKQTADWKMLKVYRVPFAQPNQVSVCHFCPFVMSSKGLPADLDSTFCCAKKH